MPRGGKRPGAGAPKGNLNAFKHGYTSKQYKRLIEIVAADPEARKLLIVLAKKRRQTQRRDKDDATRLLDYIATKMLDFAHDQAAAAYEHNRTIPPPAYTDGTESS